ncbi:MAG: DNA polymerase III subunit delta' [Clostridiales bacterium]|jgi:DNA polymerase-3 subunit delta'|nr:DNA polymerase III subunit delta' [Clostridiales bacterium]
MSAFDGIIGGERLKAALGRQLAYGRVSHAYLLEGTAGTGKALYADRLAKALVCLAPGEDGSACGVCSSCALFVAGNNPDVIRVQPDGAKLIGVDEIRERVNREASVTPYAAARKVFIIRRADAMTPAAQNALLKTLEEPPGHAVFILTARPGGAVLPTIRSRCQTLNVPPVSDREAARFVSEKTGADYSSALEAARFARGGIGAALRILANERFSEISETVRGALAGLGGADIVDVYAAARKLSEYKDSAEEIVLMALLWYTDLLEFRRIGPERFMDRPGRLGDLSACRLTESQILSGAEAAAEAGAKIRRGANPALSIEIMLYKMNDERFGKV